MKRILSAILAAAILILGCCLPVYSLVSDADEAPGEPAESQAELTGARIISIPDKNRTVAKDGAPEYPDGIVLLLVYSDGTEKEEEIKEIGGEFFAGTEKVEYIGKEGEEKLYGELTARLTLKGGEIELSYEFTSPEPEEPEEPEKPDDESRYAEMSLVSNWNSWQPHVFVYFKNLTDHDITVGCYTCPAGQGVSVGSLGLSVSDGDGAGIYYNIETYRNAHTGRYRGIYCISKVVSKSELANVSDFIINHNKWEFFILNCCWFAAKCWNAGGGAYILPIVVFPSLTRIQMLFHHSTRSIDMYAAPAEQVMRQVGEGSSAYCKVADTASLT